MNKARSLKVISHALDNAISGYQKKTLSSPTYIYESDNVYGCLLVRKRKLGVLLILCQLEISYSHLERGEPRLRKWLQQNRLEAAR